MARFRIFKKDGKPTPFFWSEKDGRERTRKRVFKRTKTGVTRMRGVHYNVDRNEFKKE